MIIVNFLNHAVIISQKDSSRVEVNFILDFLIIVQAFIIQNFIASVMSWNSELMDSNFHYTLFWSNITQPSVLKWLKFLKVCLKVVYFFVSKKQDVPLHPTSNICSFRWKGKHSIEFFLTNSKPSCRVAMQFDIYYLEGNWDLSYLLFKWLRPLLLINPVASWKRDHDFKWKFSWYVKPWTLSELWLKEKILRRKCMGRGEKLI